MVDNHGMYGFMPDGFMPVIIDMYINPFCSTERNCEQNSIRIHRIGHASAQALVGHFEITGI